MDMLDDDDLRAILVAVIYFGTWIAFGWSIRRLAEHVMRTRARDLEQFWGRR